MLCSLSLYLPLKLTLNSPVDWVNPLKITETTFDSILRIAENEFDWPEMSATTGYTNIGWIGHPNGIVNSSYVNALQNNRCTMRGSPVRHL